MHSVMNNSYISVDLGQVERNVRTILAQLPAGTKLIPVLKDDAYGLGMLPIARRLAQIQEIRMIAVSHVAEGVELRQSGYEGDILVMGGTAGFLLPLVVEHDLTLAIGRPGLAAELAQAAREGGKTVSVHIKVETGLHRMGLAPGEELDGLIGELRRAGDCLRVEGAFTHFADPEDEARTRAQYQTFLAGTAQLEGAGIALPMKHVSGSAGSELYPEYHLDAVRIGRRLYMDHPTQPRGDIKEAVSWRTFVTRISRLRPGDQVGYHGDCALDHPATVATIGVGYGDGLDPALAQCRAPVLVNGKRARLLTCCMDQSIIEVTGIPCAPDDEVTLFGRDSLGNELPSQEVALLIGDGEGCGLTSKLSRRVARIYF